MASLFADCRLALRGLRKAPVFTTIAVLSIALGIGANTAIFALVDQVLLRLLPVKSPHELVLLQGRGSHSGNWRGDGFVLSYPMYRDFAEHNQAFSGMFCRFGMDMHVGAGGRTERVRGDLVSGTFFPVLGVGSAAGRTLAPDDDRTPGAHPVAVLSHSYWKGRFAGDPAIVGQKIVVNDQPMTIVGVAQEGFEGVDLGSVTRVFIPIAMKAQMTPQWNDLDNRRSRWVHIFGRLKPAVTVEQARASLQTFYTTMLQSEVKEPFFSSVSAYHRDQFLKGTIHVQSGAQGRVGIRRDLSQPLWVLMAIVAGVLLIACANLANLLLARGAARQREMAIRLALGASRWRVVRQLLVESVLLSLLGGLVGLALAAWGTRLLLTMFRSGAEHVMNVSASPDVRILAFNFAIAFATGLVFGTLPALQSTRPALAPTLKDQAGSVLGGGQRLRKALVVSQVALSLLLLIGAGLFLRSLRSLLTLDPGFRTSRLVAFSVDPALNGYTPDRRKLFYKDLRGRLATIPGVSEASFAAVPILGGDNWSSTVRVDGYQSKPDEDMNPAFNAVSPGYFRTLGIPIVAGRDFADRDERTGALAKDETAFRSVIVNEAFARKYFGNGNPLGRRLGFGGETAKMPIEIVGVVKDAKYQGMREEIRRQVFVPYLEDDDPGGITAYVRTSGEPEASMQAIRRTVQQIDANVPIFALRTVEEQLRMSVTNERLVAGLSILFGSLATLLAMIGLYGVMAYSVARRTREIGIRMALGARPSGVAWLVGREVGLLVLAGIVVALPGAWWLGRFVQSQLYGLQSTDPLTIGAAIVVLAAVGAVAGLVPARRAASVNPIVALRYE
jgi:predicted permease